jgi:ubiquitin-protein ligase
MIKRIINETEQLSKKYSHVDLIEEYNNTKTRYNLYVSSMTFLLNENYPFVPPVVQIRNKNNQSYFSFMKMPNSNRMLQKLKIFTGNDCLCCNTILCNWNPSYRIEKLMDEIERVNQIKRQIKYSILLDEICDQYNIPIQSYIFEFLKVI